MLNETLASCAGGSEQNTRNCLALNHFKFIY